MSPPAGVSTGLAYLPNWLTDAKDASALDHLLSGWVRASGWRTVGLIWPTDGKATLGVQVRPESVEPLPAAPSEIQDVARALRGGTPTVVWQLPNSSGRLYTLFQPAGRPAGLLWAERGPGEPWTDADRSYLVLATRLIERSPAMIAKIGPLLEPGRLDQRLHDAAIIAGRMAHDFDNILTGIIGFADLSVPLLPAGSQAAKFVGEISKVGQRGITFTQQLHQLSRSAQAKPQPGSVGATFLKEELRLRPAMPAGLQVVTDVPANLIAVGVDNDPLGVVLGHLLENAIEASAANARIHLSAKPVELTAADAKGYLGPVIPGPHVEITVQDRGAGIKPEQRAKLFAEPFFTTKVRHRGLGLAIVYRVLHAHGGGIRIDSATQPETGTTVRIVLPPAAVRPSATAPSPRQTNLYLVGG